MSNNEFYIDTATLLNKQLQRLFNHVFTAESLHQADESLKAAHSISRAITIINNLITKEDDPGTENTAD